MMAEYASLIPSGKGRTGIPLERRQRGLFVGTGSRSGSFVRDFPRRRLDLGCRSERRVERNGNARYVARVGVDPVIEPTGEYKEQPRLRPNPKRLAVRISRRSHGLHARPRIEELQKTTERPIGAVAS